MRDQLRLKTCIYKNAKFFSLFFYGNSKEMTPRSLTLYFHLLPAFENDTMPYPVNSILIIMSHLGVKCFNHYRGCSNSSGHNEINKARRSSR